MANKKHTWRDKTRVEHNRKLTPDEELKLSCDAYEIIRDSDNYDNFDIIMIRSEDMNAVDKIAQECNKEWLTSTTIEGEYENIFEYIKCTLTERKIPWYDLPHLYLSDVF